MLAGCGGGGPAITSTPSSFDDTTLAGDLLSTQLAALHHALPGPWQQVASAGESFEVCARWTVGRAGMTAQASSPSFVYRHSLGLRVATLMFSGSSTARGALAVLASGATRSCLAAQLAQGLRARHYTVATTRSNAATLPAIGSDARAMAISVPVTHTRSSYTWHLDAVAVRQGRRIELLASTSTVSKARYDRQLAAALARVTKVAERYLQTGQAGSSSSAGQSASLSGPVRGFEPRRVEASTSAPSTASTSS
jgi:hypothetical protein